MHCRTHPFRFSGWVPFVLFSAFAIARRVPKVATHIDQVVQERASFTEDPLQSDAPSGPKRLKRVDEDVKMAAFDAVQGGRATSLPIFLRALADKRRSNANHWGDQMAMLELVKTRLCWMTGGVLSIACDDSRFSNPSEETMVFSVWHSSSGTGSWGIPQAIGACQHGRLRLEGPGWFRAECAENVRVAFTQKPARSPQNKSK